MATGLKTYSHLATERRVPSEYELTTSRLLYYGERGFEVEAPLSAWYREHQVGSPFRCSDWERFADPRQTTYTSYVALQARQEAHVEGVLRSIERSGYDAALPPAALALLARAVAPLRFACHGLQMAAAYVGQMAPAGRIAIAALLQAADETRRLQRVAYRLGQLRGTLPAFAAIAEESRATWQDHPDWQPLRRALELLLVTYDWGEALVALNLCVKPLFEEVALVALPRAAREAGDYLLGEICFSLAEDGHWHRAWTDALLAVAFADRPENRAVVEGWRDKWTPLAQQAASGLRGLLQEPRA